MAEIIIVGMLLIFVAVAAFVKYSFATRSKPQTHIPVKNHALELVKKIRDIESHKKSATDGMEAVSLEKQKEQVLEELLCLIETQAVDGHYGDIGEAGVVYLNHDKIKAKFRI